MATKFWDLATRPPRGGWDITLSGIRFTGYSEGEIIQAVRRWQQNNGLYVSDAAIEEHLWKVWCGREPERCGLPASDNSAQEAAEQTGARELNPRIYGPWIWNFMALAAVRFYRPFWRDLIANIGGMIDCPDCSQEWRDIVSDMSHADVENGQQATEWVLRTHNRVNRKLGKPQWTMAQFVAEYGNPR